MFSSFMVVATAACGGNDSGGAKSPTSSGTAAGDSETASGPSSSGGEGSSTSSEGAGAYGSGANGGGGSGGTTTTADLGNRGDLQGARLGGKVHTETETKGEAGPKSTHGQSAGEPGRTAKDIQTIVAVRREEARACYDKALEKHPGIEGDIDIKWVIDPDGNVTEASVDTTKSQILEPSVGNCIIEIIKKIKFAPSQKGYETRAHYPFNFHPRKSTNRSTNK
jgi:hypothetical protein